MALDDGGNNSNNNMKIFGHKGEELAAYWGRLHNE
jgi:hypothetical protein